MKMLRFALLLLLGMLILRPAEAGVVSIFFNELSPRPANGTTIEGVTFAFTLGGAPSDSGATYNFSTGLGDLVFVQDPVLEGDSNGILAMTFAQPTPLLNFAVALSVFNPVTSGFTVNLYDQANTLLGSTGVDTNPQLSGTEPSQAPFLYSGTPISSAVISFGVSNQRFALDNLEFQNSSVPEPGTWLMLTGGVIAIIAGIRRKRNRG